MKKTGIIAKSLICLILLFVSALMFSSCGKVIDIDTSGMILVIYNGNGGYLGNKTATQRKLYCEPGSKIPDFPMYYDQTQYSVSSLGLAMRDGYNLICWYTKADYELVEKGSPDEEKGKYLYLSAENGNGVYEPDAEGTFVGRYVPAEDGKYCYVYAEDLDPLTASQNENKYIFIDAAVDENGVQRQEPLSVPSGFYKCSDEDSISDVADETLREAYKAAFEKKTYTAPEVGGLCGYVRLDLFSAENDKEALALLANLERYSFSIVAATEDDEDTDENGMPIERFSLVSGYAFIDDVFEEDVNGAYVFDGKEFSKADEEQLADDNVLKYSVTEKYVISDDSTSGIDRYIAKLFDWNFEEMVVTEDICEWDGEKYVLNLYAHWEKKPTVYYHYNNGTGHIDRLTHKLLEDNVTQVDFVCGQTIGRKERNPEKVGWTFLAWSKSEDELDPWDFKEDVFPEGETELHLYAFYLEGEYTHVVSPKSLEAIGNDPAGKYIILNDIDFKGESFSSSPLGLTAEKPFTGEIVSYGVTLKNFKLNISPQKGQIKAGTILGNYLIPTAQGAVIKGISVECEVVVPDTKIAEIVSKFNKSELLVLENNNIDKVNLEFSGIIGEVISSADGTVIEDCSVKMKASSESQKAIESNKLKYSITVSDFAVKGQENLKAINCASEVDTAGIFGDVELSVKLIAQ